MEIFRAEARSAIKSSHRKNPLCSVSCLFSQLPLRTIHGNLTLFECSCGKLEQDFTCSAPPLLDKEKLSIFKYRDQHNGARMHDDIPALKLAFMLIRIP